MRWGDMRPSDNVEDARRQRAAAAFRSAAACAWAAARSSSSSSSACIFGVNPLSFLGMMEGGGPGRAPPQPQTRAVATAARSARPSRIRRTTCVRRVVGDTEDVWTALFKQMGSRYEPPTLVAVPRVARDRRAARRAPPRGPFYCPADRKVYLDTAFFQRAVAALRRARRLRAGVRDRARDRPPRAEPARHDGEVRGRPRSACDARQRNALSVRLELQADCYAGVWGFYAAKRNLLEPGDVEEGLRAASAVGDDTIQKARAATSCRMPSRTAAPAQRVRWFRQGMSDRRSAHAATRSRRRHLVGRYFFFAGASSAVPLEAHAPHDAVVFRLHRHRHFLALARVHAAALGAARSRSYWHGPISGWRRQSRSTRGSYSMALRPDVDLADVQRARRESRATALRCTPRRHDDGGLRAPTLAARLLTRRRRHGRRRSQRAAAAAGSASRPPRAAHGRAMRLIMSR